jgi:hypothetical protein
MAKIQFSAVVGDARKKLGGVVFTKGHAGAVVRKKVSPVQPRTSAQRTVRANFTANSKAWSGTLTASERQTFTNLAASLTKKDRFGNAMTLTGAQLYQAIARNLHTIGIAPLTTAPASMTVSDLGGLTLTEVPSESSPLTGPGITIETTNAPATGEALVIAATASQAAGRSYIAKGKYRVIGFLGPWPGSPALTPPFDVTAQYEAKFGALKAGMTIHILVYNIGSTNGAKGTPYPGNITLT